MYEKYLNPVIEEFTTGEYYSTVYQAKEEFFEKAGVVYEDDSEYEERMCIFINWYVFDRDLPGIDLPPIKYFFKRSQEKFTSDERRIYQDLCETVHSIFRLKRKTMFGKSLIIQDIFSNKRYRVNYPETKLGFSRGDLFEARIIPFKNEFEFSKGFCFHPREMESFICNEVKKVRFQKAPRQTKLILQLAAMKLKHLRYQHIDVRHIYTMDSRF